MSPTEKPGRPTLSRTGRPIRAGRGSEASKADAFSHRTVEILGGGQISVGLGDTPDDVIRAVAAAQWGRVTREQLLTAGISPSLIDRRLRNRRLERAHAGVYALPHTEDLPWAAAAAALLACGPGAALSHHSAATLWALRPGQARPVHVTIPAYRGFPAPPGVRLHRSRILTPADIRIHQGLPVTSPARALLDVAATLPDRDVERLLHEAVFVRRLVTLREIHALLRRSGNHPGRRRLARIAEAGTLTADTNSPPAERLLRMIRAAGLPEPRVEASILDYRLDFYWPELSLAVEVDAYGTHGSPVRFESERRRDARLLTELGIIVIRITRITIDQRPLEALALVTRAIGQREAAVRSSRSRSR
jgi:very-short-patch-repair endonuclease